MRKFIIKYWFGNYDFNGTGVGRAVISNFTLMFIAILAKVFVKNQIIAFPLMVIPLFILVFTTFYYLGKYPVKWGELDKIQKHHYGYIWTTQVPKFMWPNDFKENYTEWVKLDNSLKK
tara:strand:- start:1355 stop:1708 length:354 start_codon:yes stop_codon:yes gene_type:complete